MNVAQSDFVRAIFDPDVTAPEGLVTPQGKPAGERFDIYRNNVAVSLTEALRATFPLLLKSLGEDFFDAMAGVFFRKHPPDSPLLMFYGEQMPGFLESFAPVQQYPYLADMARLEIALVQSYHAADSYPVELQSLQSLSPQALMRSVLHLAPNVRLIRSAWPLFQLWRLNTEADAPKPETVPEDVLVVRPEFDPIPRCLPTGGGAAIEAVLRGQSLDVALSHMDENDLTDSLTLLLGILIEGNAITAIT